MHAEDVDAEHALDVFFGEVEKGFYLCDPGVGDHGVEGAEGGDGGGDEVFDFGSDGDIGDYTGSVAAEGFDFLDDLWRGLGLEANKGGRRVWRLVVGS